MTLREYHAVAEVVTVDSPPMREYHAVAEYVMVDSPPLRMYHEVAEVVYVQLFGWNLGFAGYENTGHFPP